MGFLSQKFFVFFCTKSFILIFSKAQLKKIIFKKLFKSENEHERKKLSHKGIKTKWEEGICPFFFFVFTFVFKYIANNNKCLTWCLVNIFVFEKKIHCYNYYYYSKISITVVIFQYINYYFFNHIINGDSKKSLDYFKK